MKRLVVLAALAALVPAASAMEGHGGGSPPVAASQPAAAHRGVGVVRKVDAAEGKVTLQHGPIESLGWPAMTMAFRVPDRQMLAALRPGAQVRFAFVQRGSDYVITAID